MDPSLLAGNEAGAAAGSLRPYVQLIEVTATPLDAADAIELPDELGRVPIVVRIRRQPPIKIEWLLIALALVASGLLVPLELFLRVLIILGAVVAVVVGIVTRLFLRIPPGSVGLVARGGRHKAVLQPGVHTVNPSLALTHLVTTRHIAFDVPVSEVRSADGVGVNVDLLLTLGVGDPVKLVYSITTGDLDQFIHATCQDAVRTLARKVEALDMLDLSTEQGDMLRATIDVKLAPYGMEARAVAFPRVVLPGALTASLEARRLAVVQLAEEHENFALEERRLSDRATLLSQEQEQRQSAIEFESIAEDLRLSKLEARLAAYPRAAAYDLELGRLRVAQQVAGNSRAVVSLGGGDLVANLLAAREMEPGTSEAGAAEAWPAEAWPAEAAEGSAAG
jgi:regulator of protease activity HflC (stomatin/prohibitin superfamily)